MNTILDHITQQHQSELMAGLALNPAWFADADDCSATTYDYRECDRLAASAPTAYLAGLWRGKGLVLREVKAALTVGLKEARAGKITDA